MKKKQIVLSLLMMLVCIACTVFVHAESQEVSTEGETAKALPLTQYWSADSPVAESLRNYVKKVTDPHDQKNFIPVEDRIAVFDMDGTLTCETFFTYYDTMMFIDFCNNALDGNYWLSEKDKEELKEVAASITPDYKAGEALARDFARAYSGMTVQDLYDYAVEFGKKETKSFNNMRYCDGLYLPMGELVKYLYDNDFTIYVISGTERTTSRAIIDNSMIADYVSPAHVIGSEFEIKLAGYEKTPSNMDFKYGENGEDNPLVYTGGFVQKNLHANKTIWVEREIGQRPVLAFGNSGSDTSMMNYALINNKYPSEAYMVVADDTEREWGKQSWEEKSKEYIDMGYIPVSMKNDFAQIYPEGITIAETQYVAPAAETEKDAAATEAEVKEAAETKETAAVSEAVQEAAAAASASTAPAPTPAAAAEPAAEEKKESEPETSEADNVIKINGLLDIEMDEDGSIKINSLLDGLTDKDGSIDLNGLVENTELGKLLEGLTGEAGGLDLGGLVDSLGLGSLLGISAAKDETAELDDTLAFPSWNPDSAALAELIAFVEDCTDEASPNYLEPEDRLATFDMDGTILCERAPVYADFCMTLYRVLDDPTYKATEEERAAMQEIRDHAYSEGKPFYPKTITKNDMVSKAFAGMTPKEFREYSANFAENVNVVGFDGMTYAESFYKPMLEVIAYLKANDFDVWMVSASEREFVRALVEPYDIPYDHVIATDVPYVASGKGDEPADDYNMSQEDVIVLGTPLDPVECGKSGKPAAIAREIGKYPVLAFGNSSGDYSMLNYAESNPDHEGKGFFIVCDDTVREYGSDEKAAEYYTEVESQGWTAISMANDWDAIYGEDVVKTELPGAQEAVAEAA